MTDSAVIVLLFVFCFSQVLALSRGPPYKIEDAMDHFRTFINDHKRQYKDKIEEAERYEIFKENLQKIIEMNKGRRDKEIFGITKFMDLTVDEFKSSYLGLYQDGDDYKTVCRYITDADVHSNDAPESFDWRDKNVVTPVKDQATCTGSYAFSAIGNIESQYAMKHQIFTDLSEQQIIDCDKRNYGCGWGYMSSVFRSLIEEGGCESEEDYTYMNEKGSCQFKPDKVKLKLADCHSFDLISQEKLKEVLYKTGPISVAVRADGLSYLAHEGIITDDECNVGEVNHGVLLVGYGTEASTNTSYWIVKNSWGPTWGEKGYFRMERGEYKLSCGVMNDYMATAILP